MKKILRIISAAVLGLSALSCYDDTDLRATIEEHEAQLEAMKENIASLETLIQAIANSDYVVSVTPLEEDGEEVGYFIKFAESGEIKIYHGKDGDDGQDGDSVFEEIYEKDGYIYFVLTDGTIYNVPMSATDIGTSLDIIFDVEQGVALVPNNDYAINYSIVGASGNTVVRVMWNRNFMFAAVMQATPTSGQLVVGIQSDYFDSIDDPYRDKPYYDDGSFGMTREEYFSSQLTVLVTVSDDKTCITKALNISEGKIESVQDVYVAGAEGGQLKASVRTNIEYKVNIPENCTWLTYVPETKSSVRTDELVFSVASNPDVTSRSVEVEILDEFGYCVESFCIEQNPNTI